jgi:hypothetical protein
MYGKLRSFIQNAGMKKNPDDLLKPHDLMLKSNKDAPLAAIRPTI